MGKSIKNTLIIADYLQHRLAEENNNINQFSIDEAYKLITDKSYFAQQYPNDNHIEFIKNNCHLLDIEQYEREHHYHNPTEEYNNL